MSHDVGVGPGPEVTERPWIAELIPGQDILLILDPSVEVPGEDAVEELRMQAYERRDAPTMGAHEAVEVVQTVAGWAASGVVGNAAFALFPATWAFVQRWRERRKAHATTIDDAMQAAVRLCPTALRRQPSNCEVVETSRLPDGWRVRLLVDWLEYEFIIDSAGSVASFERAGGSSTHGTKPAKGR